MLLFPNISKNTCFCSNNELSITTEIRCKVKSQTLNCRCHLLPFHCTTASSSRKDKYTVVLNTHHFKTFKIKCLKKMIYFQVISTDNWGGLQVLAWMCCHKEQHKAWRKKLDIEYWFFFFSPFSFFYLMLHLRPTALLKMKWPALKCASLPRSHLTLPDRGIARTQMEATEVTTLSFWEGKASLKALNERGKKKKSSYLMKTIFTARSII